MANEHILNNDVQISGSLNVSQSISASAFYGDGSNLLYVTASSQWNGILTGSADITGSLTVRGGDVDLRLSAGVTGSFSGSFEGDGSGLTGLNLNGYQASGSILSGSFTGSFIGNGSGLTGVTASFLSGSVSNATTASLALTASYLSGTAISSSYAVSSSFANTASYCNVAFTSAQTASYVNPLVQNVQLTGSLDIVGSQSISSTVTVSGKIQSETGVDILATNGVYWKGLPFSSTAIGGVNYNNGISFFAGGIVTPRMFISSSGNVGIATTNPSLGRLQVQGNVVATSFTGSLFGTASYAAQALSSSIAVSSSYSTQAVSASHATTASYYNTSLLTPLSTFNTFTSSYNTGSFTGSFTGDGSGLTGITSEWDGSLSGSGEITGSLTVTDTITAGLFVGDGSGITGIISPTAISASYALTASYVELVSTSESASFALTAETAISASYAETSSHSLTAEQATSASYAAFTANALSASYALTASHASNANTATSASYALSASYSNNTLSASYADYADTAQSASHAETADFATSLDVTDQPTGTGPYYPLFTDGTINNTIYVDSALYSYNATTNTLTVTASRAVTASHALTALQVTSASYAQTASLAPAYLPLTGGTVAGNLTVTGNLTAQQYIVSSSVTYFTESFSSGSTRFGDTLDDTHQFTGSLSITGSLQVGNNSAAASISNVGSIRYRTSGNNSYVDMSMQTGASTYEWVNIVQNNW